ncbi:hypothetical protein EC988_002443, partial [Linderina pennispora]
RIQLHQVKADTCVRVTNEPFSSARRSTPAYSRLLALSNKYGYIAVGAPSGISVFTTADAEAALVSGDASGDGEPVVLAKRNEISVGKVTHVTLSADELSVIVALATGSVLVFAVRDLLVSPDAKPSMTIDVDDEIRDLRPNPLEMPTLVAVLTLSGAVLMADIAQGTTTKITSNADSRVTAICWSRKGKQIVCGDTDGVLTQRAPNDGAAKRTIQPPATENHPSSFAVLAVDWIETYTFMAIYGQFPPGGFVSGNGGGGNGSADDEDEFEQVQTAAYIITQTKKQAPMHWKYIEDPCTAMDFPMRYPGFHFASIYDWGASVPHMQFLTSTGSTDVKTIAHCLPGVLEGGDAGSDGPDWCDLDTDPFRGQFPLAVVNTEENDTTSLGMAIDFTSTRDLPPLNPEDSTAPMPPQPILWILTTDGCLLGYYVYNTVEIERGQQCTGMVKQVQPLPGAAALPATSAKAQAPAAGKEGESSLISGFVKSKAFGGTFSSILAPKPNSGLGGTLGFGTPKEFKPSFGPAGASAFGMTAKVAPNSNAPTTFGISGQRTFGQAVGASAGAAGATSFAALAEKNSGSSGNIFDQPASGPSLFDQPPPKFGSSMAKKQSFWGEPVEVAPAKKPEPAPITSSKAGANIPASVAFGSATGAGVVKGSVFAQSRKVGESKPADTAAAEAKPVTSMPMFSTANLLKPSLFKSPKQGKGDVASPFAIKKSPEAIEKHVSFAPIPSKKTDAVKPPTAEEIAEAKKLAEAEQKRIDKERRAKQAEVERLAAEEQKRAEKEQRAKEREEHRLIQEQKRHEADERRAERRRRDELRQDLRRMSSQLVRNQFVLTLNKFDSELKQFKKSVRRSRQTIKEVHAATLPPIEIDESVTKLASATVRLESLSIGDTGAWNSFADVLAGALLQSRKDLESSYRGIRDEQTNVSRIDTRGSEIKRILESANSMRAAPNATVDGGMNPLQREIHRRLQKNLTAIKDSSERARELIEAVEANRQCSDGLLGSSLLGPSPESIDRKMKSID